jgi:serine phosphatase RsbU (regulator of sigma subunit)/anti-sigma regulatory factor (Ser/Thr protein kinase)
MSTALDIARHEPGAPLGPPRPRLVPRAPRTRRGGLSIRWIVVATSAALIAAAVTGMGVVSERATREALNREIEARLLLQSRGLALAGADALLSDFPELTLHPLSLELKERQPDLALIVVVDGAGRIQGDPDVRRIGQEFRELRLLRDAPSRQALQPGEKMQTDGRLLVASAPVSHRDGRRMGTALVGLPLSYVEDVIQRARRGQMVVFGGVMLLGVTLAFGVMSFVLRPVRLLRAGIERIGHGDLDTPLRIRDRTEFGVLADAVNGMAAELKRAQSAMLERERLASELELARQIQASLLPNRRASAGPFLIQGSNRAAQEVGGDYYDYFELPDGRIGLAIADVSGKGLAGCMVMSMLSALLRAYRDTEPSPAEVLATLDARLSERLQRGSFVTMFYGVLDPASGELVFANAGHSPLLVLRSDGRAEWRRTKGIPLGAVRGGAIRRTLENGTVTLGPGDLLIQFTDGVNEAFDPAGREQFGFERLESAVREAARLGVDAVLAGVHSAVEAWVGSGAVLDDETMLVVARGMTKTPGPAAVPPAAAPPPSDAAPAPEVDAMAFHAEAVARGLRLELPAHVDSLVAIREWLATHGAASRYSRSQFEVLGAALYEACANIAEHGCGNDPGARFDLWYVASAAPAPPSPAGPRPGSSYFLIRDHGRPFRAEQWKATDFRDRKVWKRGRGFGLDIIHRSMSHVSYHPSTAEGNLTLLVFEPLEFHPQTPESRHG